MLVKAATNLPVFMYKFMPIVEKIRLTAFGIHI